MICRESIHYSCQNGRNFSCTPKEIEIFFGVTYYMGIVVLPTYGDYFRTDDIEQLFVRNAMPRDRFVEILQNLHFNGNMERQATVDKAWKVRSLILHFNFVYQRHANEVKSQSVDEHMVKFKGNNTMKQYIQNKPIKWGFKIWERCCSLTGCLTKFFAD